MCLRFEPSRISHVAVVQGECKHKETNHRGDG